MPEPKKRMSRSRSRKRQSQQRPDVMQPAACAKCGRPSLAHRLCKACAITV